MGAVSALDKGERASTEFDPPAVSARTIEVGVDAVGVRGTGLHLIGRKSRDIRDTVGVQRRVTIGLYRAIERDPTRLAGGAVLPMENSILNLSGKMIGVTLSRFVGWADEGDIPISVETAPVLCHRQFRCGQ